MRRAVIDVGSNSVLLVVADMVDGDWKTVFESSSVTGLGTGVKSSGLIAVESMARTLRAVSEAFAAAASHSAPCHAFGTMALRIARNAEEFLAAAYQQGTPVHVISGEEEARLGVECVLQDPMFRHAQTVSVIDPGGHSTEVTIANRTPVGASIVLSRSVAVGALGLVETQMPSESPDAKEQFSASCDIDALLDFELPQEAGTVVALGATPTNLIGIRERLATWQPQRVHGQALTFEEVSKSVGWLCSLDLEERGDLVGIEKGRERTLHAGALILERFMNALRAEECRVSVRGWRYALLGSDI